MCATAFVWWFPFNFGHPLDCISRRNGDRSSSLKLRWMKKVRNCNSNNNAVRPTVLQLAPKFVMAVECSQNKNHQHTFAKFQKDDYQQRTFKDVKCRNEGTPSNLCNSSGKQFKSKVRCSEWMNKKKVGNFKVSGWWVGGEKVSGSELSVPTYVVMYVWEKCCYFHTIKCDTNLQWNFLITLLQRNNNNYNNNFT